MLTDDDIRAMRPTPEQEKPDHKPGDYTCVLVYGGEIGFRTDVEVPGQPCRLRLRAGRGKALAVARLDIAMVKCHVILRDDQNQTYTLKGGPQGFDFEFLGPDQRPIPAVEVELSADAGRAPICLTWELPDGTRRQLINGQAVQTFSQTQIRWQNVINYLFNWIGRRTLFKVTAESL